MSSSSRSSDSAPAGASGGMISPPGTTPAAQQPAAPPWVRYPSFLPSDPGAQATGLTQNQVNAIDKWSLPAFLTPTEVEGGTTVRGGPTTPTPGPTTPTPTPVSLPAITQQDLGNRPTGQMLALVGQEGSQQNRHVLADLLRRQREQEWR
jgi:hypothetical protein